MSLLRGFPWSFENMDFQGYSIAGQTTSIVYKNAKICFDIAQGLPFNLNAQLYCLTHLHADHGSGLNYLLSQRSLFRLPQANIMLPERNVDSVHKILKEWEKIEGFDYDYNLIGVKAGTTFDFSNKYKVMAFPTTHRVTSFGYIVYEKKKKLLPEFEGQDRQEILDAKSQGKKIEMQIEEPKITITGDTQIEFLEAHPDVTKSDLLFMECTYLDEKKDVSQARQWGHIHLDEIIEKQDLIENKHICLIHLSARYPTVIAEKILASKLNQELHSKISIFPRPI